MMLDDALLQCITTNSKTNPASEAHTRVTLSNAHRRTESQLRRGKMTLDINNTDGNMSINMICKLRQSCNDATWHDAAGRGCLDHYGARLSRSTHQTRLSIS